MTIHLYADGGVILKNPSAIGGTWAWQQTDSSGFIVRHDSGYITPELAQMDVITNNLTEMLALLYALQSLPQDSPNVHIYSDSQITLGRIFLGCKWKNIPPWMHNFYIAVRGKQIYFTTFKYTLLDGHPTKAQLAAGIGKRGNPVSIHNVWCDQACREQAERFMASHAR